MRNTKELRPLWILIRWDHLNNKLLGWVTRLQNFSDHGQGCIVPSGLLVSALIANVTQKLDAGADPSTLYGTPQL